MIHMAWTATLNGLVALTVLWYMLNTGWSWIWKGLVALVALWHLLKLLGCIIASLWWVICWLRGRTLSRYGAQLVVVHPRRRGSRVSWLGAEMQNFAGHVFVWEVGEPLLYQETGEFREHWYGPVIYFDPGSPVSDAINVFDLLFWHGGWERDEHIGQLQRLATHLLAPEGLHKLDPIQAVAVPVLTSILLYCCSEDRGHLPGVLEWMLKPTDSLQGKLQTLAASADAVVASGAHCMLDLNESFRAIVWQTILAPLMIFQDPVVERNTRETTRDVYTIANSVWPIGLYCRIPWSDLDRLGGLSVTLFQIIMATLEDPRDWSGHRLGETRHDALVCVDPRMHQRKPATLEQTLASFHGERRYLVTRVARRQRTLTPQKEPVIEEQVVMPAATGEEPAEATALVHPAER